MVGSWSSTPGRAGGTHRRLRRPDRRARVRRHPHALRRAAAVGSRGDPVAAARGHVGGRRQLRLLDRPARRARRLHMRMMAVVEGIPLAALEQGGTWDWHSFGELLDRFDGSRGQRRLPRRSLDHAPRGHGRRRRGRPATPEQIGTMGAPGRVDRGARSGSRPVGRGPHRRRRQPGAVPRRVLELLAMARVVRDHAGTTSIFPRIGEIPGPHGSHGRHVAGGRPAAQLEPARSMSPVEIYEQQLTACDLAASGAAGGRVHCPTSCASAPPRC